MHTKLKRGFAAMDPAKQKAISSKGGKAVVAKGNGHKFTRAEASWAGRLGGTIVSQDRGHMATIGRSGGVKRGLNAQWKTKKIIKEVQEFSEFRLAEDFTRDMGDRE